MGQPSQLIRKNKVLSRQRIIAGKAVIVIEASNKLDKGLGAMKRSMHRFANTMSSLGDKAFRTGFLGAIASGAIIRQFTKFEDATLNLQTKLQSFGRNALVNDRQIKTLETSIRGLAQTTTYTAEQVTQAAVELAKAGSSIQEIQGGLEGVLDLARGTGISLEDAATTYARVSKVFGVVGDQLTSSLVRTTKEGTLNITELAEALKYSSATARSLNIPLNQMLATFSAISDQGLVGSIAGTSTNTGLANLIKKQQEIEDLGASFYYTADGGLDFVRTLRSLREATAWMSGPQLVKTFQGLFNLRGARAMIALVKGGFGELEKDLRSIQSTAPEEAGSARRARESGSAGRILLFRSAFEELAISIGKIDAGPLNKFIDMLTKLTLAMSNYIKTAAGQKVALAVIFAPAGLLAAGVGMLAAANGARMLAFALGGLQSILGALRFNPLLTLIASLTGVGASFSTGLNQAFKALGNTLSKLMGPFKLFWAGIQQLAKGNAKGGIGTITLAFQALVDIIKNQLLAAWNAFTGSLGPVWDFFQGLWKLIQLIGQYLVGIFDSIKSFLSNFSQISSLFEGMNMASAAGNIGTAIGTAIGLAVQTIADFIDALITALDIFIIEFEKMLRRVFWFGAGNDTLADLQYSKTEGLGARSDLRMRQLDKFVESMKNIDSSRNIDKANRQGRRASGISNWASELADKITTSLKKPTPVPAAQVQAVQRAATPQMKQMAQAAATSRVFAAALVGSASATRGNMLGQNVNVDKEILEQSKLQAEYLKEIAANSGTLD